MSTLELEAVHKGFGDLAALRDITLGLPSGSRTAIIGPSGSGKTTLLRLIAGFEFADSGVIRLEGVDLSAVPAHQRRIGYVLQDGALFPHLRVADNIGFGLPGGRRDKRAAVQALMAQVELDARMLDAWPHQLSGGQQQRVALARALAQRPRLMLLDEPFSALDTGLRASMRKAVAQLLSTAGITTILVTHDQAEALSFADQLAVMRDGCLVQAGEPMALYQRPRDERTALFLGEAIILDAGVEHGVAHCVLGALPLNDPAPSGPGRVLLRPEQLSVRLAASGDDCTGVIRELDFGGHSCLLAVELDRAPGQRLHVRSTGLGAPPAGARVSLAVQGGCHWLRY